LSVSKQTNLKRIAEQLNVTRDIKALSSQFSGKKGYMLLLICINLSDFQRSISFNILKNPSILCAQLFRMILWIDSNFFCKNYNRLSFYHFTCKRGRYGQLRIMPAEGRWDLTLQRGVTGTARMLHALTHSSISRQVREQM